MTKEEIEQKINDHAFRSFSKLIGTPIRIATKYPNVHWEITSLLDEKIYALCWELALPVQMNIVQKDYD